MRSTELFFEVIDGYHVGFAVAQGDKTRFKQRFYMHNGGPFPIECRLDIPAIAQALPIGNYKLLPTAFRVGKYGDPEINNWEIFPNLVSYEQKQPISVNK
jgi:hypothetical protein